MTLARPQFVSADPEQITQEMVSLYETIVGRTLHPAQPERLFIDVMAYRECLLRQAMQEAAEQNLVSFARDAALDQLGNNLGIKRLEAASSTCTVKITLTEPAAVSRTIPAGIVLATTDSKFTFSTSSSCLIAAGETEGTCAAVCSVTGPDSNGYLPGSVVLAAASNDIASAVNITATANGADKEDDESFRERIPLAMEAFSCAGPALAYEYWAKAAHQSIIDVAVMSPSSGVVNIYPLTESGVPDQAVISAVEEAVTGEKRRPLTDLVQVMPPHEIRFTIDARIVLYATADRSAVLAQIDSLLSDYGKNLRQCLGRDVVPSQISALLHIDGVYSAEISSPQLIAVSNDEFPVLESWNITVGAVVNEQ